MDVISRVRQFIREHDLIRRQTRVLAAVSGGPDSMALLHVLRELDGAQELRLAGVAHFNHQLREDADDHERFVHDAARSLALSFASDRGDVRAIARHERTSIELAARRERHAFLERARVSLGADLVATGHTADDLAETFLLRLTRGAGPRGLSAIHPRSGETIRPLLTCRRPELIEWLTHRAGGPGKPPAFVEDRTNRDVAIPRNRVRHELLPLLADRFNPSIVKILAAEASLQQDLWAWLEEANAAFTETPGVLSLSRLCLASPPFRRLVVWQALKAASGGREIGADHVSLVIRLIEEDAGSDGKTLDLPGQRVQRINGRVVLTSREAGLDSEGSQASPDYRYPLSIPGRVLVPHAGLCVSAEVVAMPGERDGCATAGRGVEVRVRSDVIVGTLAVRNRRPGDRYRPVGLNGSKKLQDLFVDVKVPRAERDHIPVVVDETDRIVWVAGYGIDEAFQVTDTSQHVLVLRLTRASGGGTPGWFGGSA
jgi:tRNA(Ile)-lysidine synthase